LARSFANLHRERITIPRLQMIGVEFTLCVYID
jgi:hypothetical protein